MSDTQPSVLTELAGPMGRVTVQPVAGLDAAGPFGRVTVHVPAPEIAHRKADDWVEVDRYHAPDEPAFYGDASGTAQEKREAWLAAQHVEVACPTPRLPTQAAARKAVPLVAGCIDYFPDALAAVAGLSVVGNEQHNPGKPLAWDRAKSGDEAECIARHLIDRGTFDTDGVRHSVKVAWRALALLQKELEAAGDLPLSRGSR